MIKAEMATDIGLLILRVLPGLGLFLTHGWKKLTAVPGIFEAFPDPLGLGPAVSAGLAIFAEVICAVLVTIGLFTRLAAVPVVILLLVAAIVVHADDPWGKKEFALIYCVPFLALIFTGAGKYSLDSLILRKKSLTSD
jgi:putative oxidoreductase